MKQLVLCPGSRSGPLATAAGMLASQAKLQLVTAIDERSAAFLALGMATAHGRAVAVITTSGTAVANLLPAAVEADRSCQPLLLLERGVQRLFEGQVEVNRSRRASAGTLGLLPSLNRQGIEDVVVLGMDAVWRTTAEPAAGCEEEGFLINRLVGAAVFEPDGAIRREQQQGLTGAVRLHRSGQQVGHRGAGGGDNCHGTAMGGCHAEGQKRGRALIDGRDQLQLRLGRQHARRCC